MEKSERGCGERGAEGSRYLNFVGLRSKDLHCQVRLGFLENRGHSLRKKPKASSQGEEVAGNVSSCSSSSGVTGITDDEEWAL